MRADLVISVLTGGFFVYVLLESRDWGYRSALFPEVIGVAGLVCVAALLFVRLVLRRLPAAEAAPAVGNEEEIPPQRERRMAARFLCWLVALTVGAWLFGQLAAMTAFIGLYLRFESELSWTRAIVSAALSWAFLYAVFEMLLKITWLDGALWRWLGLL